MNMYIIWNHRLPATLLLIISLAVIAISSNAQVLHHINHGAGTQTYGQTDVTVTATGNFYYNNVCFSNSYWIGRGPVVPPGTEDYKFSFSVPTDHIQVIISGSNTGERFRFKINNQDYILKSNELFAAPSPISPCVCGPDTVFHIDSVGRLAHTGFYSLSQQSCIMVEVFYPGISALEILYDSYLSNQQSTGGSFLTPFFEEDTTVFIQQPYTDTVKCPGDSLALVYSTNFRFNNNNTFTAQLSNAGGSFANPVNIGSRADTTGDTIWCKIPENIPSGNGYRIRIVSSSPADTSLDNQVNIRIKAAPANISNSSNSPVCTGDTLHLTGNSSSSGITWAWTGPGSFSSSAKDTFIANAQLADSGKYILKATLNSTGCSLYDTSTVEMRPTPTKPTAGSNSPVCETLPLTLTSSSGTTGVSYSWQGPGSYSSTTQNPTVTTSASSTHAGDYISTATLNGCSSRDTTTVVILPKPAKPTAGASNSPLCQKQDLQLTASTVTGASYAWYGPSAFTANTQNPVRANIQMGDAGAYYVYATVSGCVSDTDSVVVTINTDPFVNIFPTPGATICSGQQVIFTAVPTNGGNTSYNWLVNGIATGSTGTTYSTTTLNNGDAVSCAMTSTGTCATPFIDTSNAITMTVQPILTPTVTMTADKMPPWNGGLTVTFTATPTHGGANPEYQWKRNG
ncbi:MAG: hypothetical protein H3C54_14790, partial [Taibaiella sp.]|nr:hypothetical protein [Taibaiella sp.]